MSAPISDVVDVTLTTESAAVQSVGFGIGLILATHKLWTDRVRSYGATSEMTADGFLSTDTAYVAAARYLGQSPSPLTVKIGRRSADVVNIAITAVNAFLYSLKIDGIAYTYTSDGSATQAEIGAGLIAAYNAAVSGLVMTYATGVLTLTGTTDLAFSVTNLSANLAQSALTASATIAHDLDAIVLVNPDFYGVVGTDRSAANQKLVADWAASNGKLAFVSTQEANTVDQDSTTDTTTLGPVLKALGYDRAAVFYSADANANFIDAAAMGRALALQPGSYTLSDKDLQGVAVSSLTPTQRANSLSKNVNVYEARGGLNQVNDGRVASGKFVDQIHGRDWLVNEVAVDVFAAISAPLKVPYTDAGILMIEQAVRQAGELGVSRTYLESFTVTTPKRADTSSVDRANRLLKDVRMSAVEAGAIHKAQINILVSV